MWETKENTLVAFADILSFILESTCPVLSGNMKAHLEITEIGTNSITICVSAPFYDLNEWRKSGAIIYTGSPKKWPNMTDYALWVNDKGAFGKGNKSKHWINRVSYQAANLIANTIGAIVINNLDLS